MASNLPGGGLLAGIGSTIATDLKLTALLGFLGLSVVDLVKAIEDGEVSNVTDLPGFLERELEGAIQNAEQQFGGPLWELLVRAPAGLDAAKVENGQAADAVKMVKRMLGFGLALPLLTARLEAILKGVLGAHAPDGLLESIRRLPEEIGVNFFIGTVLERIFETAVATPLEEAIAEQTRPARFDFRVVKALLTKHHITREEADLYLARIGYRDEDITRILELGESFLSVGDLQQLYLLGLWKESDVDAYLETLGYSDVERAALIQLYLTKAETTGGQQLRATARTGFLEHRITEAEYRHLLEQVNTPLQSIELEVQSAQLLLTWGRRQLSVADLKRQHDQGQINDRQAIIQLGNLGFTEDDGLALVNTWAVERKATRGGLTVAHILSYELGGVIDHQRALQLLLDTGMKPEDAALLAANPGHLGGVFAHPLSVSTVLGALREGVLEIDQAKEILSGLNVDPVEIELAVTATVAKMIRGGKPKAPHKGLTEAQVLDAFKQGLVATTWVLSELAILGYSDSDAQVILAIELTKMNKSVPDGWVTLA